MKAIQFDFLRAIPDTPGEMWLPEARKLLSDITHDVVAHDGNVAEVWSILDGDQSKMARYFPAPTSDGARWETIDTARRLASREARPWPRSSFAGSYPKCRSPFEKTLFLPVRNVAARKVDMTRVL